MRKPNDPLRLAVLGTYLPRRCGIATFTADLCDALEAEIESGEVLALAMNDRPEGYPYPERVRFELQENAVADYRMAAEFLAISAIDAVIVQHEFGIFGGPEGAHVLRVLREVPQPVITTLHTILDEPEGDRRAVLEEVLRLSDRVVSISARGVDLLRESFDAPPGKLVHVPHGIPDVPFVDPNYYKDLFGVEGRRVILTFGLLGPGKGVEWMVRAMPAVVERHPETVYIVLGATHPHERRAHGEAYRQELRRLVRELSLQEHVIFQNRFVTSEELAQYLGAADVYVTPYLAEGQVSSGTLVYALGAGKAVVSTPYLCAKEMLADGRGRLVPFRDPGALAHEICDLFENSADRHAMRRKAYQFCRPMIWRSVGRAYLDLVRESIADRAEAPRPQTTAAFAPHSGPADELPELDLRHLRALVDDTGVLQHCIFSTPDRRHGYSTDDNARALAAIVAAWRQSRDESLASSADVCLAFLLHAFDPATRRFRGRLSYDRKWPKKPGTEYTHARALWALGAVVAEAPNEAMASMATRLFRDGLPALGDFTSPLAWAYAVIGIHRYLERFRGDADARRMRGSLAERLFDRFGEHAESDWPWCDAERVGRGSARTAHALLMAGQWIPDERMKEMALRALDWLLALQTAPEGHLSLLGTDGGLRRDGTRARFEQMPAEVQGLVEACAEAFRATGDARWKREARRCIDWFLGGNDLRVMLYNSLTGGCCDSLTSHGPNANQGTESTLAWLLSLLAVEKLG